MREKREPSKSLLEIVVAMAALVIVVACALAEGPRKVLVTPAAELAREHQQNQQSFAELRTRDDTLAAQVVAMRSDLAELLQGQSKLGARVSATATRLQQLETSLQQTDSRLAEVGKSSQLQQIIKERDAALVQNKRSDDEIRQLTLKLQRAGVFP